MVTSIIITEHQVMMMKKYGLTDDEIYLISQQIQSIYDFERIIQTVSSIKNQKNQKNQNNTLINLLIAGKNIDSKYHHIYHYIFKNNDTLETFIYKEPGDTIGLTTYL